MHPAGAASSAAPIDLARLIDQRKVGGFQIPGSGVVLHGAGARRDRQPRARHALRSAPDLLTTPPLSTHFLS
jgi:hypothetical protein